VAYLAIWLGVSLLTASVAVGLGRMRPPGVAVLGPWDGYAHPSRPVAGLALALTGVLYTLVPRGRWRRRGRWLAWAALGALCLARLYLAVDHPSDVAAALAFGWALPVVVYRLATPDDVFPVTYRGVRRAHLDVSGERGAAVVQALDHQLGLDVVAVEPFGQEGSAGSTPLRLHVRRPDGTGALLFGKLYALSHLRSDRWYKLARTILYGRLEDEKPFSTVRRLVMYEDHLLRLLRDVGLPTPKPYGFVEITPEREYLVVMELFEGTREIGEVRLSDREIDDGLRIVRRLWDAGVAHRDVKPSNLLVRDGHVLLIDVAFGSVRATPWRQAVDLADMMLTLALSSDPDRVYDRALRQFAPDDIAEAFAACRSITVPTQLRARLRADRRDLAGRFRELAPRRPPVPVQLWSVRRVGATLAALGALCLAVAVAVAYVRVAGLV
ncbi:MAG TPA: phosphatase PAP2 family protein, partial [Frankiaceae bacterium]|nr:phosphatase PAP2 family protein [Frankiaceae bacterium]